MNAAISFMCDQLKTKFHKLNEHILPHHFNWDGIHLNKSGTMALENKIYAELQSSPISDDENWLETHHI